MAATAIARYACCPFGLSLASPELKNWQMIVEPVHDVHTRRCHSLLAQLRTSVWFDLLHYVKSCCKLHICVVVSILAVCGGLLVQSTQ